MFDVAEYAELVRGARSQSGPRVLVSYQYHDARPNARSNLAFFLRHIEGSPKHVHYVFVVNGEEAPPLDEYGAEHMPNVMVLRRTNTGYDLGAHGAVLSYLLTDHDVARVADLPYDVFIFLNCGTSGPTYPSYMPAGWHWTDAFAQRVDDRVRLVGVSVFCSPIACPGNTKILSYDDSNMKVQFEDVSCAMPIVETWAFALERRALDWVLEHTAVFGTHWHKINAVLEGEAKLTRTIMEGGWTFAVLQRRYATVDWSDPNWHYCGQRNSMDAVFASRTGEYFGGSADGFEWLFTKSGGAFGQLPHHELGSMDQSRAVALSQSSDVATVLPPIGNKRTLVLYAGPVDVCHSGRWAHRCAVNFKFFLDFGLQCHENVDTIVAVSPLVRAHLVRSYEESITRDGTGGCVRSRVAFATTALW